MAATVRSMSSARTTRVSRQSMARTELSRLVQGGPRLVQPTVPQGRFGPILGPQQFFPSLGQGLARCAAGAMAGIKGGGLGQGGQGAVGIAGVPLIPGLGQPLVQMPGPVPPGGNGGFHLGDGRETDIDGPGLGQGGRGAFKTPVREIGSRLFQGGNKLVAAGDHPFPLGLGLGMVPMRKLSTMRSAL